MMIAAVNEQDAAISKNMQEDAVSFCIVVSFVGQIIAATGFVQSSNGIATPSQRGITRAV